MEIYIFFPQMLIWTTEKLYEINVIHDGKLSQNEEVVIELLFSISEASEQQNSLKFSDLSAG